MNLTPDQVTNTVRSLIQRRAEGDENAQVDIMMRLCTRPSETYALMLTLATIAAAPVQKMNDHTNAQAVLEVPEYLPPDDPTVLAGRLIVLRANRLDAAAELFAHDVVEVGLSLGLSVIAALLDVLVVQGETAKNNRPFPPQNPELN